jgi:hypothetical protein
LSHLKEQRKVEKLEATVANLAAIVKEQTAQRQQVSAEIGIKAGYQGGRQ